MGKKASIGEVNQRAMGVQSVQDYLDKYAPIERTVVSDLLSTQGTAAESGRVQAANGMAWNAATTSAQAENLTQSRPDSGGFVAKTLDLSRQRGSGMGLAKVQTAQTQAGRTATGMMTGAQVGRGIVNTARAGVGYADRLSAQKQLERDQFDAERREAIYGTAGEVLGMASGAALQHSQRKKDYGDYYTEGGKTYWKNGTLADGGTSFA